MSTSHPGAFRNGSFTNFVSPIFTLTDARALACDPALLPIASDWCKVYHPRTTLARAS